MKTIWTLFSLAVILTLGVLAPASASAEETGNPIILPEPTEKAPLKFTDTSIMEPTRINFAGIAIECEQGSMAGEFTSKRLGKVNVTLKNCVSIAKTKCHTEGDEAGVILFAKADIHLVAFTNIKKELKLGVVIKLAQEILVNCTTGSFLWRGSLMGQMDVANSSKVKEVEVLFNLAGGKQELKECDLDKEFCFEKETHKSFLLEVQSGKEFLEVTFGQKSKMTFEKEVAFDF